MGKSKELIYHCLNQTTILQPPYNMNHNSMNTDIMQECLAPDFLNKVLTLRVCLCQKLPMVTNYLVKVNDVRHKQECVVLLG